MPEKRKRSDKKRKEYLKKYYKKPEVKARMRAYEQKPEVKAKSLERGRRRYLTPEGKAKVKAYNQRPKVKARKRKLAQRPEVKAKSNAYHKKYSQKPENKAKAKERSQKPEVKARAKAHKQKPKVKARNKAYSKKYNKRPKVKARNKAYAQLPEVKARRKELRDRPEIKARIKSHNQLPGVKARNKTRLKKYNQRPEIKARIKSHNQLPEVKARIKAYAQLPEVKARRKEYRQQPEVKARREKRRRTWYEKEGGREYYKQYTKENEPRLKKYRKEYWSSPEVRTRVRKYFAEMDPKKKEELNKKSREYGSSPKGLAVRKARYYRTIDARHAEKKRGYEKVKREVFSGLSGGEPKCAHCKETEFLFLTIDHVGGPLSKTAKEKRGVMKSDELYRMIRREFNETGKWSNKYQVLCYCCNMIKEIKRPKFKKNAKPNSIFIRKYRGTLKLEVLSHYSNGKPKCACCSWDKDITGLSIDHIYGRKNPKEPKGLSGEALYRYVKKSGYPPEFRVLCLNCNAAIGHHGICPHKNSQKKS